MAFRSTRWRCSQEFFGNPYSNDSDANPPEGDNPRNLLFSSRIGTIGYCGSLFDCTVKLGDKERFDKEQIGVKEPFPVAVTNCQFTS